MSSEFKDIEQLFSDKLQNFEVTPPESVWKNIQQKKRKGLLFFFKDYLKVAVLLLLLTSVVGSVLWFNNSKHTNTSVVKNRDINKITTKDVTNNQQPNQNDPVKEIENSSNNYSGNNDINNSKNANKKNSVNNSGLKKDRFNKNKNTIQTENISKTLTPLAFDEVTIASKNEVKLKYLIYPSLMQFVYNNKRIGKKLNISRDKEKEDPKLSSRYSMEILGGPSYASKRLSGDNSLLRKESEIATMSIQTGLKLNYHINPKFNIQTGVIIENRNEKIKFSHSEIQQKLLETPKQVTVYHPVLPPKTITVIDSTYTDEVKDYNFNTTNKYTTISVPLVLGYRFALGKAQYRFSAGTLINVHSVNSSSVLTRIGNEIILTPYRENNKIKASVYSAFALQLPLSPTCNFITEVSYYNNLKNRLKSENSVQQINYGFNLSIGASFDLKK